MLGAMTLLGAVVYYVGCFFVLGTCAVAGAMIGKTLRSRKDAKNSIDETK